MRTRTRTDEGASAVEYGLLAALIAGVVVASVLTLGETARDSYQNSCTTITTAMGSDCG